MDKITWTTEKRTLGQLIPYEHNPRQLTTKQHSDLKASLTKFNLAEIPAINTDNKIVAGHQRTRILLEIEGPEFEIDVRVPSRTLTEAEFKEYLVRSNKNTGEWDMDILANSFDVEDLQEWGFENKDFGLGKVELLSSETEPESPGEFKIEVTCLSDTDCQNVLGELKKKGYECRLI